MVPADPSALFSIERSTSAAGGQLGSANDVGVLTGEGGETAAGKGTLLRVEFVMGQTMGQVGQALHGFFIQIAEPGGFRSLPGLRFLFQGDSPLLGPRIGSLDIRRCWTIGSRGRSLRGKGASLHSGTGGPHHIGDKTLFGGIDPRKGHAAGGIRLPGAWSVFHPLPTSLSLPVAHAADLVGRTPTCSAGWFPVLAGCGARAAEMLANGGNHTGCRADGHSDPRNGAAQGARHIAGAGGIEAQNP